ncbi:MAG: hypothetical protein LC795_07330 [Acidobacteria bacterium]|nr:hypothetical protein [Acidobacteriota bacterium]
MTFRKLLSAALFVLLATPQVCAQYVYVPDVKGVCVSNCGDLSGSSSTRDAVHIPAPPPNPLPGLASDYKNLRGWFRGELFRDAPAFVEPANMSELDWALTNLRNYADRILSRLRSEKAALESQAADLREQMRRDGDTSGEYRREIAGIQSDIAHLRAQEREVESSLSTQKTRLAQVEGLLGKIEEESKAKRDALFAKLDDAERNGLLLPPSIYRARPEPPPPTYGHPGAVPPVTLKPASLVPLAAPMRVPVYAVAGPTASAAYPVPAPYARREPPAEAQLRAKLSEISGKTQLISAASVALDAAYDGVVRQRRLADATSSLVQTLSAEAEALRTDKEHRAATVGRAKAQLDDAVASYQRLRGRLPLHCLEQAFWNTSYKNTISALETKELILKSKHLIKGDAANRFVNLDVPESLEGRLPGVDVRQLGRLKRVMNHVLEMQKDTLAVIERVPAALVDEDESPAELQAELDAVVRRFQLNLADELGGLPQPLRKLFERNVQP